MQLKLLALFFFCWIGLGDGGRVKITSNGYESIVVALPPSMSPSEGLPLIGKIKDLLTRASQQLYIASQQRAFFRQITILVPHDWPKSNDYESATWETFAEADIRVDTPNPEYGDGPYTLQQGQCGEPGMYIHLAPGYLNNYATEHYTEMFGEAGKTMTHEWAHYRWGVFDEFGIPGDTKFPTYYFEEKVIPNICNNEEVQGMYWNMDKDEPCDYDENNRPNSTCRFIPDLESNTGTSSLTSVILFSKIQTFCDNTEEHKHNSRAPNKQNFMCDGRSAWEVILISEDFKNNNNPPAAVSNVNPTFRVVQKRESGTAFVFVLDVSGSMQTDNKIGLLHEAAVRWLRYELKLENAVGVVAFQSLANLQQPVTKVTDEATRNLVINKIPTVAGGGTCIKCGLQAGLQALRAYNGGSKGGVVILLTDGEDGEDYVTAVRDEVLRDEVKIITIALTANADGKIEKLAQMTGGKSFFVDIKSPKEALNSAFYETTTLQTVANEASFSLKLNQVRFVGGASEFKGSFVIDASIGKNSTVDITYNDRAHIRDIGITGPSFSVSLGSAKDDSTAKIIRFFFPDLKPGTYNYVISSSGASNQEFIVTAASKPNTNVKPFKVACQMETKQNSDIVVYATVTQGNAAVIRASVRAKVDRPSGLSSVFLDLKDNGAGADGTADDGVYSSFFTQHVSSGRYSVQAQVSDGGTALVNPGFTASPASALAHKYRVPNMVETKPQPTGEFERVTDAGSFQVTKPVNPSVDSFPPNAIRDLEVLTANPRTAEVVLRWTSPGDDYDQGKVSAYDLRFSLDMDDLIANFEKSKNASMASFIIVPGGTVATFKFEIPRFTSGYTYYFALKAVDKAGHWAKISNVAQTHIPLVRRAVCKKRI